MSNEPVTNDEPTTADEYRASIERNANLVFNIGTIVEDRGLYADVDEDEAEVSVREHALWQYLYENLDYLYEQVGPIIDAVEDAVMIEAQKGE